MVIVSSREFRDKQKSYLDKVDEGVEILIRRGKNKSYRIIPVVTRIRSKEELSAFFDSL